MRLLLILLTCVSAVAQPLLMSGNGTMPVASAPAASCETVKDSYTVSTNNSGPAVGNSVGNTYRALKITASSSYTICSVSLLLSKEGATATPSGNVVIQWWTDNSNKPGTALSTSAAIDSTTLPAKGSSNWVTVPMPEASVTNATVYWLSICHTNTSAVSYIQWFGNNQQFYNNGVMASTNGTTWNAGNSYPATFKTLSQ